MQAKFSIAAISERSGMRGASLRYTFPPASVTRFEIALG